MSKLFSPCRLGPLQLKNPVVYLPFFTAYADENGAVTAQLLEHYARMADSGAGLIVVEAASVRDRNLAPHAIRAFGQEHFPGLTDLAGAIHTHGAKAVLQICHAGRFAYTSGCLAPSEVAPFGKPEMTPKAMDGQDMADIADAFAESAAIAKQAGFDGVELHGGTGYLLASFTSPYSNRRTDAYGGSVENRARFPLEVCRAVRERVGDYPVGYRFMAREYVEGGLSLEEGLAFARLLAKELSPAYLSVTAGMHECFAMLAASKQKAPRGFMLPEAEAVKKAVPDTSVIAAGQLATPGMCEKALESGAADAIGLGRILFADPDWLRKAAGELPGRLRPCVQCDNCVRQISKGSPAFCTLWTKEEKERFLGALPEGRKQLRKAAG